MRRLIVISLLALTAVSQPRTAKEIVAASVDLMIKHRVSEAEWTREVLAMIHETPAPRDVALAVATQLGGRERVIILADALRDAPDDAGLIRALAHSDNWVMDATFGPVTFVRTPAIRAAWRGRADAETLDAAVWQIAALVNLGRAADAVKAFDALPDGVQTAILARKASDEYPQNTQLDLAACAAVVHQAERATKFLSAARDNGSMATLVRALIAPTDDDPYEVLATSMQHNGVWAEAAAILADRGGYGRFAAVLRDAAGHSTYSRDTAAAALPLLQSALRSELQATLERDRRERTALYVGARVISDNGILSLLRGAPTNAYEERPLPVEMADVTAAAACHTWKGPWPEYSLQRCEARGQERIALGVWSELDPGGGSFYPSGGWWLYHSTDSGTTWEKVYTGVRERSPYSLVKASRVPMLTNGGAHIEADVFESGPRIVKPLRRVIVAFSWSELRRDTDGDGLPDLVEERLVTDPRNRDTDGDGIEDGIDPQPQIASSATSSVEGELLGMALGQLPATWTGFFVGDHSLVAASGVKARLVVLTRDEADAYRAKFGLTAFGDLSFLLVRRDGKKAVLYLDYATAGNTWEFEKKDGVWTRHDRGGWVS